MERERLGSPALTDTDDSSVLHVTAVMSPHPGVWTVHQPALVANTPQLIKMDGRQSKPKEPVPQGNGVRGRAVSQLPADHGSVVPPPFVVTHCAPQLPKAYLHSALSRNITTIKSYLPIRAIPGH